MLEKIIDGDSKIMIRAHQATAFCDYAMAIMIVLSSLFGLIGSINRLNKCRLFLKFTLLPSLIQKILDIDFHFFVAQNKTRNQKNWQPILSEDNVDCH